MMDVYFGGLSERRRGGYDRGKETSYEMGVEAFIC